MRPIHIATAATAFVAGMAGLTYIDRQPNFNNQAKVSGSLFSLSESIQEPTFKHPVEKRQTMVHSNSAQAWKAMLSLPDFIASKEQKEAIQVYLSKPKNTLERQEAYNNVRQLFNMEPQLEKM